MTDLKTLKQLVKLMVDNDLTELNVEGEGDKVKLRRGHEAGDVHYVAPPIATPVQNAAPVNQPHAASEQRGTSGEGAGNAAEPELGPTIDSPMVGTFYTAPSPDAAAFVSVGDHVDADSVVCIIEAMKVFNEIKAETSGTIRKILVESGQAVEFGQPLFEIEP